MIKDILNYFVNGHFCSTSQISQPNMNVVGWHYLFRLGSMNFFNKIVLMFCFVVFSQLNSFAQTYQLLSNDDFQVDANGVITSCTGCVALSLDNKRYIEIPNIKYNVSFTDDGVTTTKNVTITGIGEGVFRNNNPQYPWFEGVKLPANLKFIGNYAFSFARIKNIELPASLESIGNFAFHQNSIESITIPMNSKLKEIGIEAFSGNNLNSSLIFPAGLTKIGNDAFSGDIPNNYGSFKNHITSLTFPSSIESIGENAFNGNAITSVAFSTSVSTLNIGTKAFYNNLITAVTFPNSFVSLANSSFQKNQITSITFGGVTTIPPNCFDDNHLANIRLPQQITNIGDGAFGHNTQLTNVWFAAFDGARTGILEFGKDVFVEASAELNVFLPKHIDPSVYFLLRSDGVEQQFPAPLSNYVLIDKPNLSHKVNGKYTLTSEDVEIENGIITKCTYSFSLTEIVIPETIGGQRITGVGTAVFANKGIKGIKFPGSITSIGSSAFEGNKISTVILHEGINYIGPKAFKSNMLSSVAFPLTITSLTDNSFEGNPLTQITSFGGVTSIGQGTFRNTLFTEITFPKQIVTISDGAFAAVNNLANVVFEEPSRLELIGNGAFGFTNILPITLPSHSTEDFSHYLDSNGQPYLPGDPFTPYFNKGVDHFRLNAVFVHTLLDADLRVNEKGVIIWCNPDTLAIYKGIRIPQTVKGVTVREIATDVFTNFGLVVVKFPAMLTTIRSSAFADNHLIFITFPNGLTSIGDKAFKNNLLRSIKFPTSIVSLGDSSFARNPSKTIEFLEPSKIVSIGANSFSQPPPKSGIVYDFKLPDNSSSGFLNYIDYNGVVPTSATITNFNLAYFARRTLRTLTEAELKVNKAGIITYCSIDTLLLYSDISIPASLPFEGKATAVTGIDKLIFANSHLFSVEFPNTIVTISDSAFYNDRILSITLPPNLNSLGVGVFSNNLIKEILSFAKVHTISAFTFANNKLNTLVIPTQIECIGKGAFKTNPLTSVSFTPKSRIEFIDVGAFDSGKPSSIVLPTHFYENAGFSYYKDSRNLIHNPSTSITDYNVSYLAADFVHVLLIDQLTLDDKGVIIACNYCFAVKKIEIPDQISGKTITGVGDGVFKENGLTSVKFPNNLAFIGPGAFKTNQLTSVDFPASLTSINFEAFTGNRISEIKSFGGLKTIGPNAFSNNKFSSLVVPPLVEIIGKEAFSTCITLTSLTFSGSSYIKYIGPDAFSGSSLTGIKLPENANPGFQGSYLGSDGIIYDKNTTVSNFMLSYTSELYYILTDDDVTVVNGVITSCSYNFVSSGIKIPETLDGQTVIGIADEVFARKEISDVRLPNTLISIGKGAFKSNKITKISFPASLTTIDIDAFSTNDILRITSFGGVKHLGDSAFRHNDIEKLEFPAGVEEIGNYAFADNQFLVSVIFSENSKIRIIHADAFFKGNPTSITLPTNSREGFLGYEDKYGSIFAPTNKITDFTSVYTVKTTPYTLKADDLTIVNGIITACSFNFNIKNIIIPSSVVKQGNTVSVEGIGNGVFKNKGITNIKIPSTIKSIGDSAFYHNNLLEIVLPISIVSIGDYAFYENHMSGQLSIQSNIVSIGKSAFDLNDITGELAIPNSVKTIGDKAFFSSSNLTRIYFSSLDNSDIQRIGIYAFSVFLKNVSIQLPIPKTTAQFSYWESGKIVNGHYTNLGTKGVVITDFSIFYEVVLFNQVRLTLEERFIPSLDDESLNPKVVLSADGMETNTELYSKGSKVVIDAIITDPSYRFLYWEIVDKNIYDARTELTLDVDTIATAYFVKQVALNYNSALTVGGLVTISPTPVSNLQTYDINTEVTLSATSDNGYRFDRWQIDNQTIKENPYKFTLRKDLTLKASFIEQVELTVTQVPEIEGNVILDPPIPTIGTYDVGTKVTFTAIPKAGYKFEKWVIGLIEDTNSEVKITLETRTTATAYFLKELKMKLEMEGLGNVENAVVGDNKVYKGKDFTLRAVSGLGYEFQKWVIDGIEVRSNPYLLSSLQKDISVKVFFQESTVGVVHLNVSVVGEGFTQPPPGSTIFGLDRPKTKTFNAAVAESSRFSKWVINGHTVTEPTTTWSFDADIVAVAFFIEQVTLDYSSSEGGTVTATLPTTGLKTYDKGSRVAITARVMDGYRFDRWEVVDLNGSYTITSPQTNLDLNSNTVVQAHFIKEVTLKVQTQHGSARVETTKDLEKSRSYVLVANTNVRIVAIPDYGYEFDKIEVGEGENKETITSQPILMTVDKDISVFVYFRPANVLGVDDLEEPAISYYPNPVSDKLSVKAEGIKSALLISLDGKTVCQVLKPLNNTFQFDVYQLNAGMYFLQLTKEDGNLIVKKVLKQ